MYNPTYLTVSRHSIFYFKWPLPGHVRLPGRTSHVKVSLRTREPKEALRLAHVLEYHAYTFMQREGVSLMDYIEIKGLLETYFRAQLEFAKGKIDKDGPYTPEEKADIQKALARTDDPSAFKKFNDELDEIFPHKQDIQMRNLLEFVNVPMDSNSTEYAKLKEMYRHAAVAFLHGILNYSEDQSQFAFAPRRHGNANDHQVNAYPDETLENVVAKFLEEMNAAKIWSVRAAEERVEFLNLLKEILGASTPVRKLGAPDARKVKEILMKLPKNRGKMKSTRDIDLYQQLEVKEVEKLSVTSVNKYLQCYSSLFSWAVKNGYLEKNIFHGMFLKVVEKKRREGFSPAEVARMVSYLSGHKDSLPEYAYWGTLIAAFTGARLNEIASLTCADVKKEDGVWQFDINDKDEKKKLKTKAATRRVPVHSELIRFGLLNYVDARKESEGQGSRLLAGLTYSDKEGWGRKLGRWFNTTFLKKLAVDQDGLSFHSLRHTVITNMRRASVERPIVQALVGHEPDGVTEEVYTHGYQISQLQHAIEKLKY